MSHFLLEKSGTLWENILFLEKYTIFGKIYYFWENILFLGKCSIFGPILESQILHHFIFAFFTALPIIDTGCSIFQYILFILHYFLKNSLFVIAFVVECRCSICRFRLYNHL